MAIFSDVDPDRFNFYRLNLKTIIGIYRELGEFIEAMDAEAQARGEPEDQSIDADFRSGVYLGVGCTHLILSLMPGKILAIVELFGYKGDRMAALAYLNKCGGWSSDSDEPSISKGSLILRFCTWVLISDPEHEGIRRSISDMCLLIFHLVLSGFTFNGIDINMAQKVLDWNLKRYPNGMSLVSKLSTARYLSPEAGVFFLFAQGRMSLVRSQPAKAIEYYRKAADAQQQYRNLHLISFWEIAVANLALWDVQQSLDCWVVLKAEATVSQSCSCSSQPTYYYRSGRKRPMLSVWPSAHCTSMGKRRRRRSTGCSRRSQS